MMYTKGIRKIFGYSGIKIEQRTVEALAGASGYDALVFNGEIYILDTNSDKDPRIIHPWTKTCFQLTDFSDEQV